MSLLKQTRQNIMAQVNDIYFSIAGYNMTLVEFFQVVGVTKTGKSVKVKRIVPEIVDGNVMVGTVTAKKDNFVNGEILTRRLNDGSFVVSNYSSAYKWSGEPIQFNRMD